MIPRTTMGALSRGRKVVGCLTTDPELMISALFLVPAIRLGLWLLPVRVVGRALGAIVRRTPGRTTDPGLADRVGRAVGRASRMVPGATCLTQALAAQALLEGHGLPTRLHIGVVRDEGQVVRGHAWVESQGVAVIGAAMAGRWSPLLVVEDFRTWSSDPGRSS
jgi:hypothetical protein